MSKRQIKNPGEQTPIPILEATLELIKEKILHGGTYAEISLQLQKEGIELSPFTIEQIEAKFLASINLNKIIIDHVNKYEQIYAYFYKVHFAKGMNRALIAKEKLLKLHEEDSIVVSFKQQKAAEKQVKKQEYNFDQLSKEEKKELKEILSKCGIK